MSAPNRVEAPLLADQRRKTPREITDEINVSTSRRLLVTLAFPLVILLAIPFWWYTTSIERLPLPVNRIEALSVAEGTQPRSTVLFSADGNAFPKPAPGRSSYTHEDVLNRLSSEVTKSADGILGQQRPAVRGVRLWDLTADAKGKVPPLRIHLRTTDLANTSFPLKPYIQPKESGLMTTGLPAGTCVIPIHTSKLGDVMLNKHYQIAAIKSLAALFPSYHDPPSIPHNALKYAPNVTLSFVLLNEDSSTGSYVRSWDIEGAIREHITPHLEPLNDVFNFTVESQILYHAPLSFEPNFGPVPTKEITLSEAVESSKDAVEIVKEELSGNSEEAWQIGEEEMKIFVNSEKWSLDSGSTNNPVLRFLLFVPSAAHRPMRLSVPDSAESFLIPQYGSVSLLNPPPSTAQANAYHLPLPALEPSFHLFTQSLYSLLALPQDPPYISQPLPPSPLVPVSPFLTPLSRWQVEQVWRMRTKENSDEARKTLKGIVRLVANIKEMKVGEGVRGKVLGAVERLEKLDKETDVREAFILSRDAVGLANEAFFDPSMMGLLYFPDEHKFAVYTPLFAPVAIPMIIGLIKEFLAWRRRRRARASDAAAPSQASTRTNAVIDLPAVDVEKEDAPVILEKEVDDTKPASGALPASISESEPEVVDVHTGGRVLRSRRSTPAGGP